MIVVSKLGCILMLFRLRSALLVATIAVAGMGFGPSPAGARDQAEGATQSNNYWSATTYQPNPSDAWIVNFVDGNVLDGNKTTNFYVRAVRAGS